MRNLKLIFLAFLVSIGLIKSNDNVSTTTPLDSEMPNGGPMGQSECT